MVNAGLEKIVGQALVSASAIGLVALAGCGYMAPQPSRPTRTLAPTQMDVRTFTPTAFQPGPTYTPTAAPTSTSLPSPTPAAISSSTPDPAQTPTEACEGEKKIVVDLSEQMTYAVIDYACSGDRVIVNSSLSSTGTDAHPTVLGEYPI
jgi:hypothetical protein